LTYQCFSGIVTILTLKGALEMAVIYQITNMISGKYYIGSAESFARREWQHKNDLRRGAHKNPRLQAAWNKYGESAFVFEILEEVPAGELTFERENKYLHVHVGLADCYNINTDAIGMRTGVVLSEETKQKISKNRLGKHGGESHYRYGKVVPQAVRDKIGNTQRGVQKPVRSEEHRKNLSIANAGNQNWLGKTHSEESIAKMSRPIVAVKPDGTKVEFTGLSAIKKEYGVALPTIIRACRSGKAVRIGVLSGWVLSYKDVQVRNEPAAFPEEFAHLPKTRQLAKESGAKFYFTGEPCSRGHIAPRKTKGACTICEKEDYKKENQKRAGKPKSDAAKEAGRRYYDNNKELVVARAKARSIMSVDKNTKTA